MFNTIEERTQFVKSTAQELGFSYCGIAAAERLDEEAPRLEEWLRRGHQGEMSYLERHFDKRLNPALLVPGAKTVISLLYNYFPAKELQSPSGLKISKYAYGNDYHSVVRDRLKDFLNRIRLTVGDIQGRAFVDSAPVLERAWAQRSGLGWIGKNSLLLNRRQGSFFFLAELIVDLPLLADGPIHDYCGSCTACMDACPTSAIPDPYVVDGSRCISYFTIELKEQLPAAMKGKFADWIFGCDICQDVCPWNRFSKPHEEPAFQPSAELESLSKNDWKELTEEVFSQVFGKSAVTRTGYQGLKRNLKFVREGK